MKKRKIDLVKVDAVDFNMEDGKYHKGYRGNFVTDGNSCWYFQVDGLANWFVPMELANPIVDETIISKPATYEPAPNDRGTIIDVIGAKPKSINIEF